MPHVQALLEFTNLHLDLLCGEEGLDREIGSPDINRPGLEITGCFDFWEPDRIQIFGRGETQYLEKYLDKPQVAGAVERIFTSPIPCALVTNAIEVPEILLEWGRKKKVPIFGIDMPTTRLYKRLYESLEHFFAPSSLVHGTLVDILGMGVLIKGKSGVGKSECALELVSKGHTLIADDVVRVTCLGERILEGTTPHLLRHYIEVRGLGIVDLAKLYGVRAIRKSKQIDMVITLEDWTPATKVERLGLERHTHEILGVELPHLFIPVKPGRNISTIVEVGARDQRLKLMGVDSAKEFDERLLRRTRGDENEERNAPNTKREGD